MYKYACINNYNIPYTILNPSFDTCTCVDTCINNQDTVVLFLFVQVCCCCMGYGKCLEYIKQSYGNPPIYILENACLALVEVYEAEVEVVVEHLLRLLHVMGRLLLQLQYHLGPLRII